ncbi:MAG: ATP synthase subunit I [Desulfobacterales bacterium]|nr:ATP synthase subunit I [Desulfobacterales bacterium]
MTLDAAGLALAGGAGVLIGLFYFSGLWWTVKKLPFRKKPALWVFASLLVRLATALFGFYLAAGGDWMRFLACLTGFIAARMVLVRRRQTA